MFNVGKFVRVKSLDGESSRRGMISLINGSDSELFVDLIYADNEEEECDINNSRIELLQQFEEKPLKSELSNENESAECLKGWGNILFKLKDYSAATEYYCKALLKLDPPPVSLVPSFAKKIQSSGKSISIGQSILVAKDNSFEYRNARVSDVNATSVDVLYDGTITGDDDDDEENGVSLDRVVSLPRSSFDTRSQSDDSMVKSSDLLLQRSIVLNLARCEFKRARKGWAIKYSSVALALSKMTEQIDSHDALGSSLVADAIFFRSTVLLAANRPKFAKKDARELRNYDASRADKLEKSIAEFTTQQLKSNRKLAKNLASWVQYAIKAGSEGSSGNGKNGEQGDLSVLDEDGDGEGERETKEPIRKG